MNPTQYELAQLAAMLPTGKPFERVQTAAEIWKCAEVQMLSMKSMEADQRPKTWECLPDLLAQLMPKKSKSQRDETWMEFLFWQMQHARAETYSFPRNIPRDECDAMGINFPSTGQRTVHPGDKVTTAEARSLAEMTAKQNRENGVLRPDEVSAAFSAWIENERQRKATARATKAAYARHDKNSDTAKKRRSQKKMKNVVDSTFSMPGSESKKPSSDFTKPSRKLVSRKQRPGTV